jgi:hypothetical protein
VAHIWLQNETREWTAHPLKDDECFLESILNETSGQAPASDGAHPDVLILRTEIDSQENWAVVAGFESGIAINGIPLSLGIHVFRDRDEIRWSREGIGFFSSEEPASVLDFPERDRKVLCPRCKQEIVPETPAVRCPKCKIWYHQSEKFPCYTYAEYCATCPRPASLDGGYEWMPEEM